MEAQGEKLLQELVRQEQALVAKVETAKAEAARLIEQAQAEAEALHAKARERGERLRQEYSARANAEAEAARDDVLGVARGNAEATLAQAGSNAAKAVERVMERVLP